MANGNVLTWKWLVGVLMALVFAGGGAWITTIAGDVNQMKAEHPRQVGELDKQVGIIGERTKRTEEDVKEIKTEQKDQGKKLDELLRRLPR